MEDDNALKDSVHTRLKASGYGPLAHIECRVEDGIVELAGVVPTFYLKQVAQAVIQRIERVQGIRNEIQVQ